MLRLRSAKVIHNKLKAIDLAKAQFQFYFSFPFNYTILSGTRKPAVDAKSDSITNQETNIIYMDAVAQSSPEYPLANALDRMLIKSKKM
jgi:hypothetical protein